MPLQDKIIDHLDHPQQPRRVIQLRGESGSCHLPANVRLRLLDCGQVTVTGAAGQNEVYYADGAAITIENAVDSVITVVQAGEVTLRNCSRCQVELGQIGKVTIVNSSHLSGQVRKCDQVILAAVHSTLRCADCTFTTIEATNCQLFLDRCQAETTALIECRVVGDAGQYTTLTATKSVLTLTNTTKGTTWTLHDATVELHTATGLETLTWTGQSCGTLMGVEAQTIDGRGGRLQATGLRVTEQMTWTRQGQVTLTQAVLKQATLRDSSSTLASTRVEGTLTVVNGTHRWHGLTVQGGCMMTNATVEQSQCQFQGKWTMDGGTLVHDFRSQYADRMLAIGLVGRNVVEQAQVVETISLNGSKAYCTLTECKAGQDLGVSGWASARLENVEAVRDVLCTGVASVLAIGVRAGGTLQFDGVACGVVQQAVVGDAHLADCGQILWSAIATAVQAHRVRQLVSAGAQAIVATDSMVIDAGSASIQATGSVVVARGAQAIQCDDGLVVASGCGPVTGSGFAVGKETDCDGIANAVQEIAGVLKVRAVEEIRLSAPVVKLEGSSEIVLTGDIDHTGDITTSGIHHDSIGRHDAS